LYSIRDEIIARNVWKTKEEEMKKKPKVTQKIRIRVRKSNRRSPTIQHENSIPVHIMDEAISTVCSLFKAALTKIMRGQIKYFRIRNHTHDRRKKVMDIEYACIKTGEITKIGPMKMKMQEHGKNKFINYKLTSLQTIKLHYDSKYNRYSLFVPEEYETKENDAPIGSKIGSDPGARKFQTCVSDTEAIKFGTNMKEKIAKRLNKIDKINNDYNLSKEQKKARSDKHYRKIENMVDDMHWKVIKYMTDNYKRIQIGILNTQSVVSNDNKSQLEDMMKRILISMKHYEFRQRLKYKSEAKRVVCTEVDEKFTSITCTNCGNCKEKFKGEIYKCTECLSVMDRDDVGGRNMLLKNTK